MSRRSLAGHALACSFLLANAQESKPLPRPRPIEAPFGIIVPVPPTSFQADGKTHLVYEVHPTNFGRQECALSRLEVLSPGGPALATYNADELTCLVIRPGPQAAQKEPLRIDAGLRAVVFLWITPSDVPSSLAHRFAFKIGDDPDEPALVAARIPVGRPLGSEGLPYAFRSFEAQGQGTIENGHWAWKPSPDHIRHSNELPLQNQGVHFS